MNGEKKYIYLYGDENNKRAETEDGYTIIQNDQQQWCYARLDADSSLIPTSWNIFNNNIGDKELKNFLTSVPKHLVNSNQKKKRAQVSPHKTKTVIGQRRILVILMGYRDNGFTKSKNDFERLFNEEGYSIDHAQGSVRDFYLSASYNQLLLESDIYGPYTTSHDMAFYGKNDGMENGHDANAYSLFDEAINNVARDADLSLYDGDGDGYIDNVHIIFAGYGEEAGASSNAIWSHEATFYRPYEIQGLKIDRYSCAPELRGNSGNGISRIGPHCHEIGHALGAMDYYDTNYSTDGNYLGTGDWDVMAGGSWNNDGITPADFNPYVKAYNFGWITPRILPTGEVFISPSCDDPASYFILKSSEYGDYYLMENRSQDNWGAGLPGSGLLIYHIHSDIGNAGNEINVTAPQKCYVVCASSKSRQPNNSPASYGNINSDGCPYPGSSRNRNFGQSSTPKAFYWDDETCGIELNDISLTADGTIKLTNNSKGAAFEPVETKSIFFEGFEDDNNIKIEGIAESAWKIVDNPENTMAIIDKPVAYEGVKSLQLSSIDSKMDVTDTLEWKCTPLYSTQMRIKICVASLHLRFNKPNIIKIGYHTYDNSSWQYVEIESSENNRWRQSYVELPANVVPHFQIVGYVWGGSILAIDNIEVEQRVENDILSVGSMSSLRILLPVVYSLTGTKIQKMQKGLNIVRDVDGRIKKVFKK